MSNDVDADKRIMAGFAELIAGLDVNEHNNPEASQDRAAEAMERSQARVRAEYAELGIEPPSPFALSITARRALNMPIPDAVKHHDDWMEAVGE